MITEVVDDSTPPRQVTIRLHLAVGAAMSLPSKTGSAKTRIMISVAQWFGDGCHDLLEESAAHLRVQAREFSAKLQAAKHGSSDFAPARLEPGTSPRPTSAGWVTSLKTGLEREKIAAVLNALARVARRLEQCDGRLRCVPSGARPLDFTSEGALLEEASQRLATLVGRLRAIADLDEAKRLRAQLRSCEAEAERLLGERYRALDAGEYDTIRILALEDLVDFLGQTVVACSDAGDVVFRVFLANH